MKNDTLKKFAALRTSLVNEKRSLEERLSEINDALGSETAPVSAPAAVVRSVVRSVAPARAKAKTPRTRNAVSLKELVKQVTTGKSMTKDEIYAAVKKEGYTFTTDKPFASINVVLYTKGQFKNNGGKFSPAK